MGSEVVKTQQLHKHHLRRQQVLLLRLMHKLYKQKACHQLYKHLQELLLLYTGHQRRELKHRFHFVHHKKRFLCSTLLQLAQHIRNLQNSKSNIQLPDMFYLHMLVIQYNLYKYFEQLHLNNIVLCIHKLV